MFQCDCCGLCCKHLAESDLYRELDRGDGVCMFFNEETNLCDIYEDRPVLCNVDRMYELYIKDMFTREEYYALNYDACKKFKEEEK